MLQLYVHFHDVILQQGRMALADCKESKQIGHKDKQMKL